MYGEYLGRLPHGDPLYGYLKCDVFPRLGLTGGHEPEFRVFRQNASHAVYMYEERRSNLRVVGKFFGSRHGPCADGARLEREAHHLRLLRSYGFCSELHYVADVLGVRHDLGELLVTEFCYGETLSRIIAGAVRGGGGQLLYGKLTALAYFLARMHNLTAWSRRVNFQESCDYAGRLLSALQRQRLLDAGGAGEFLRVFERWRRLPEMWSDVEVLVHGDATPANFLFGDGLHVITFDLERMRRSDRVFDTGRMAGELRHAFLLGTGDGNGAEPFIGHFLWEYACHFPDRERTFAATTSRSPFYQALTLLRIARNGYLDQSYRRRLIAEAWQCLKR